MVTKVNCEQISGQERSEITSLKYAQGS